MNTNTTTTDPASATPTAPATPSVPSPGPTAAATGTSVLAPPPAGAMSVSLQELASQAVTCSWATSFIPISSTVYPFLTLQQVIDLFRERLAALEAAGVVTPAESAAIDSRFDDVRNGRPVGRPRSDRSSPPAPVTLAGILAAVEPPRSDTTEDFGLGDIFDFFVDAAEIALGALGGLAVGGPAGAIVGGMTVYQMQHHEEGFLTS